MFNFEVIYTFIKRVIFALILRKMDKICTRANCSSYKFSKEEEKWP